MGRARQGSWPLCLQSKCSSDKRQRMPQRGFGLSSIRVVSPSTSNPYAVGNQSTGAGKEKSQCRTDLKLFSRLWQSPSRPRARLSPKLSLSIRCRYQLTRVSWRSAQCLQRCCAARVRCYPAKRLSSAGQPASRTSKVVAGALNNADRSRRRSRLLLVHRIDH
jgi:hypothetical protein